MIDIAENKWYWVTATILAVLVSGSWFYLAPTEKYDVCRTWEFGEWVNVTDVVYVDDRLSAVGKYRCDIEDKELWCGRTTTTRCYYILEEEVIPPDMRDCGTSWDRTKMSNGNTNLVLYSGVRNVFEEGRCVRIENSTGSLKKYFDIKYIKDDPTLNMTVKDFGYRYIDFEFGIKDTNHLRKMIPVKLDGVKIKNFLWNGISDKRNYRVYVNNTINHTYGFGKNSTTIQLQEADIENLEDTNSFVGDTTSNGGASFLRIGYRHSNNAYFSWIKFNISQVPAGQSIDESILALYHYDDADDTHSGDYMLYNVSEGWGEHSCYDQSSNCPTVLELVSTTSPSGSADDLYFEFFTVTSVVSAAYDSGNNNVSFMINKTESNGEDINCFFWSKEHITTSLRPYLNITYSAAVAVDNCWNLDDMYVPRDDPLGGDCEYFTISGDFSI